MRINCGSKHSERFLYSPAGGRHLRKATRWERRQPAGGRAERSEGEAHQEDAARAVGSALLGGKQGGGRPGWAMAVTWVNHNMA